MFDNDDYFVDTLDSADVIDVVAVAEVEVVEYVDVVFFLLMDQGLCSVGGFGYMVDVKAVDVSNVVKPIFLFVLLILFMKLMKIM